MQQIIIEDQNDPRDADCDARQRKAVSRIWSVCRDELRRVFQHLDFDREDVAFTVGLASYHDSPDVLAANKRERDEIVAKIALSNAPKSRTEYVSSIPHATASQQDRPRKAKAQSTELKGKEKTRSTPATTGGSPDMIDVNSEPSPAARPLTLPNRTKSLDTLRLLFPTATADLKGMIQWSDFITTLSDLGFEAEHRGGSEWTFRSFDNDILGGDQTVGQRSIVIHQPHPDSKMGAVQLQRVGKRLWRRFGWSRDRFEGL